MSLSRANLECRDPQDRLDLQDLKAWMELAVHQWVLFWLTVVLQLSCWENFTFLSGYYEIFISNLLCNLIYPISFLYREFPLKNVFWDVVQSSVKPSVWCVDTGETWRAGKTRQRPQSEFLVQCLSHFYWKMYFHALTVANVLCFFFSNLFLQLLPALKVIWTHCTSWSCY